MSWRLLVLQVYEIMQEIYILEEILIGFDHVDSILVLVRVKKSQTELQMPLGLVGNEVDHIFCHMIWMEARGRCKTPKWPVRYDANQAKILRDELRIFTGASGQPLNPQTSLPKAFLSQLDLEYTHIPINSQPRSQSRCRHQYWL
jgi:hypothetical protein